MPNLPLDALTGAYARAALMDILRRSMIQARREHQALALGFLDLDDFKSVNDAFGHARGDQVLSDLVEVLKRDLGPRGQVVRYGGDEFVFILPLQDAAQGIAIARALCASVASQEFPGKPPLRLSISLGLVIYPEDGRDATALINLADSRHYRAKRLGRGHVIGPQAVLTDGDPLLISPPRMIEQGAALEHLRGWLNELENSGSGVLRVEVPPGGGGTRFLEEAQRLARLRGYGILTLRGSPALTRRHLGALSDAARRWLLEVLPGEGLEPFFAALFASLARENARGLLLTLDGFNWLDTASLQAIQALLRQPANTPVGLVYVAHGPLGDFRAPLFRITTLKPLTERGVHIWLRQALRAEMPVGLAEWLFRASEGLPGHLETLTQNLIANRALFYADGTWHFQAAQAETVLAKRTTDALPVMHNLSDPLLWPMIVGRERELWTLERMLTQQRFAVLVGPSGVGKSRLAWQVAWENRAAFPDGVFRFSLAGRSLDDIAFELAELTGLTLEHTFLLWETVLDRLASRRILLVLEDLENHPEVGNRLLESLTRAPRVHILGTSRETLNLPPEWWLKLDGLAFPAEGAGGSIENYPAVQLFLQRSSLATLDHETLTRVGELCALARGLPLAILLLASWTSSLTLSQILSLVHQRRVWVASGEELPGLAEESLQRVLDAFWHLLSPHEQGVLARLSIFRNGFSAQAALAVAEASPFFLDGLLNKTYLSLDEHGRYYLHLLLQQDAAWRLKRMPLLAEEARRRHAEWMLNLAEELAAQLIDDSHLLAMQTLRQEYENMRLAWEWAVEHQRYDLLAAALPALSRFLEARGRFLEGIHWLTELAQRLEALPTGNDRQLACLYSRVMVRRAQFAYHIGDFSSSLDYLDAARQRLDREQDWQDYAAVLDAMIRPLGALGRYDEARSVQEELIHLYRRAGQRHRYCDAMNHLGVIAYHQGDYTLAEGAFTQALEEARQLQHTGRIVRGLNNLSNIALERGDLPRARALLLQSLAEAQNLEISTLRGAILDTLGKIATRQGEVGEASQAFAGALEICLECRAWPLTFEVLSNVADMWAQFGSKEAAAILLEHVLAQPQALHQVRQRAQALYHTLHPGLSPSALEEERQRWQPFSFEVVIHKALSLLRG